MFSAVNQLYIYIQPLFFKLFSHIKYYILLSRVHWDIQYVCVDYFLNLINYLFYFTIFYWFCHTLTWIWPRYTCVPNPEQTSHQPPQPIPLGHPSAPAPSTLSRASNMEWWFILHMIIYMSQCHSPKSSHPRPLPQSWKTVLYICVSFAVSHTGLSLPSF